MNNLLSSFQTVAGVLKLVDKPDLGSGAERRMGSIPFARTQKLNLMVGLFSYRRRESVLTPVRCADPCQGHTDHSLRSGRAAPLLQLLAKVSLMRMPRR